MQETHAAETGGANAAVEAAGREIMSLADKMMRDSWATGDDKAWQPAHASLLAAVQRLMQLASHGLEWVAIGEAEKDGTVLLVNSTHDGGPPWAAARWVSGAEWSGWVYDDDVLSDVYPLGPLPTHFLRVPAVPAAISDKPVA